MSQITPVLKEQVENAFKYSGNVTVTLSDNSKVEGYLYNREYENARASDENFIDLYLAGSGDHARYNLFQVVSVELTGEDLAAGKSYQEWLEKKQKQDACKNA